MLAGETEMLGRIDVVVEKSVPTRSGGEGRSGWSGERRPRWAERDDDRDDVCGVSSFSESIRRRRDCRGSCSRVACASFFLRSFASFSERRWCFHIALL